MATAYALGTTDTATASTSAEYRDTIASDTDTSDHTTSPMTSAYTSPTQVLAVAGGVELHQSILQQVPEQQQQQQNIL